MMVVLRTEDVVDILDGRVDDIAEVARDRLDRFGPAVLVADRQHRLYVDLAIGRRADVDRLQERIGDIGWVALDIWIGVVEHDIGDHAEEARIFAAHDDVAPDGQRLDRLAAVELDHQPLAERAADDHAQTRGGQVVESAPPIVGKPPVEVITRLDTHRDPLPSLDL